MMDQRTLYEQIGSETIDRLVEAFYRRVAAHPNLAPLFPQDFTETQEKQRRFLTQFMGGPPLYSEVHGHPRLRMRHMRFPITRERAQEWLSCMREAMDEVGLQGPAREELYERLAFTAAHMVNQPEG